MKRLKWILLSLSFLASAAYADNDVVKVAAGVNGIWANDAARPSDFEAGGTAAASLSPHIAVVGAAFFGFDNSYLRGSVGPRFTVTDTDNKVVSVGVGLEYQGSSEPSIRPQEWYGTVSVGWRPWPEHERVIVAAQAAYGLDTSEAFLMAGVRWAIPLYRGGFVQ